MKFPLMLAMFASLLTLPLSTGACSQQGCSDDGGPLTQNFVVEIKHNGKPLPGVAVEVRENDEGRSDIVFSGSTGSSGQAHINNLPSGNYFLRTAFLGISAGSECFHISSTPTPNARGHVILDWGDMPSGYRQMAGRLIDVQPGLGDSGVLKLMHAADVPIAHAKLKLQSPTTHAVFSAESDSDGRFAFGGVPSGTYVLHLDGGTASPGRDYASSDLLVSVGKDARFDTMLIAHRDPGAGNCGGTSLEIP
jgi:Carboxypeptidase regulatory-like domain